MTNKFWSIVFGVVLAACFLLFVVAAIVPWWLPRQISTFGDSVDHLFYLILAITAFFFVLTEGMLVYNIWEFGKPERTAKAPYVHGNHRLETIWTIVPAVILVLISVVQIGAWEKIKYTSTFPQESPELCQMVVVARQWEWRVRYPNPEEIRRWEGEAAKDNEKKSQSAKQWGAFAEYPYEDLPQFDDVHDVNAVHCWANGKVLVHLKTRDVLHSFFLPQVRLKQDAVPGKVIPVWFEPIDYNVVPEGGKWVWRKDDKGSTTPFEWELACAEFCGARHSLMRGQLFVHKDRADFIKWLEYHNKEQQKHDVKSIAAQ